MTLDSVVKEALKNTELSVINVIVDPMDVSPALKRMTQGLSKRV